MLGYRIELNSDDNGTVLVTCPDLPEVTTFAASEAEAPARAKDAIEEALATRIAASEPIPSPVDDGHVAPLPALALAKIELYRALYEEGMSVAELSDRLGIQAAAGQRLIDLNARTALGEMEAAFRVLGRRLGIRVSVAA